MDDIVAAAARAAAKRLAPDYGPQVEAQVEAALYDAGEARPPSQYFDPVAVGGLIVAVAALAWQVYNDLRNRGETPAQETVARKTRVEYRKETDLTPGAEKVIEIVTREITVYGDRGELEHRDQ
jgi:hypothetical protein